LPAEQSTASEAKSKPLKIGLSYKYKILWNFRQINKEIKMTEGYCVKCKKKVKIQNPVESTTAKGTKIAKGKCPDCGTTVCRMGGIQNK